MCPELEPFCWTNTFISNLKKAIRGTFHHYGRLRRGGA
jgi:hypothetical protein